MMGEEQTTTVDAADEATAPPAAEQTEAKDDGTKRPGESEKEASLARALHAERQTIKELKQQIAAVTASQEEARLASLTEQERAIEEARNAGRSEAMAEVRRDLVKAQVTAAAAAAGFADPGDAAGFLTLDDLDSEDAIKDAVTGLAQAKPYLLRKAAPQPLEQGPRGGTVTEADPNQWIRGMFTR